MGDEEKPINAIKGHQAVLRTVNELKRPATVLVQNQCLYFSLTKIYIEERQEPTSKMAIDYMRLTRRLYVLAGIITVDNTPTGWRMKLLSNLVVSSILLFSLHAFCNGCVIAGLTKDCISQTIVFIVIHVQTSIKFGILVIKGSEDIKNILDFVEGCVFVNKSYAKHIYIASFYIIALTVIAYAMYPFVWHNLPFFYETVWGSGSFLAFASSYFMVFFDLYLIQFVSTLNDSTYLLCADALCYRLNNVKSLLESIEGEEDEGKLIRAIIEHQDILRMLRKLANTISPNFFLQVFSSLTIVIFSAFSAVTSNDPQHFSACLSSFATLLTYCWLGQMVRNATEDLHFACYNNKWYNCNRKMKMNFEILSLYTRDPFEIRGCSIVRMNLQTFKEVVTDSYSYLMVLMTMDDTS